MAQPTMWRGLLLTGLIISISKAVTGNRIELIIMLTDYENSDDRTHQGRVCDFSFLPFLDSCDPQFSINVTGVWMSNQSVTYSEPIIFDKSEPHVNTKRLRSIYYAKKQLISLPTEVKFHVVVDDIDPKGSTLIESMEYKIQLNETTERMIQMGKHVKLTLNFGFRCSPLFYGPRCEVLCRPEPLWWDCDPKSGAKICLLDCGHGTCEIPQSGFPVCNCDEGWLGSRCNTTDLRDINPNTMSLHLVVLGIGVVMMVFFLSTGIAIVLRLLRRRRNSSVLAASNPMYTDNASRPLPSPAHFAAVGEGRVPANGNKFLPQRNHLLPQQIPLNALSSPFHSHDKWGLELDEGSTYEDLDGEAYQMPKECQDDYEIMATIRPPSPPPTNALAEMWKKT